MGPRDGQVENKGTESPSELEDQDTSIDSALPPRIVVELPDGGVQIGEDSQRLQHEQAQSASAAANTSSSTHRAGAQPGTEQWLELRRLLYATALEGMSLKRKRMTSLLVAIDLLYMLMTLAAILFTPSRRKNLQEWLPPDKLNVRLAVAVVGALLDCATTVLVVREHRKAVRVVAILHTCLLPPMTLNDVTIAIIRMLVAGYMFRFLACLVELDWVVSGEPLSRKPSPALLQWWLLGMQLAGPRRDYVNAMERVDRDRASQIESLSAEDEPGMWPMRSSAVHPESDLGTATSNLLAAEDAVDDVQRQTSGQERVVGELAHSSGGTTDAAPSSTTSAGAPASSTPVLVDQSLQQP